ncbi:MAG TPA: class I SAM-dependent methyltransferase [Solirubrobacteraceae bacterium]|jgi:SAM-dependent methyltransferase|nr:class I SAM-dependent methyltransferase [Solirubrobacteraceae bacterium]
MRDAIPDETSAARAPRTVDASSDASDLIDFYEQGYSQDPARAAEYARWRALGAKGKADHVIALCEGADLRPQSTLEVGCGDGALLCELHARGFGGRLAGVEITEAAVAIASQREQIERVSLYDGRRLEARDGTYGLGILSHVLEHVPEPAELLAEVARAARAVVVEVPLEANFSARRAGKREHAAEVGHLQRLDRADMRAIVARAGLEIAGELEDPLPLSVHRFFARDARTRAQATAKWALRAGLHGAFPHLAGRVFTVHYACLCVMPERA